MRYAKDVIKDVLEYRLAVMGFGTSDWVAKPRDYAFKDGDESSNAVILEMMTGMPRCRILDLGCWGGVSRPMPGPPATR
jgi:hypothetical protein